MFAADGAESSVLGGVVRRAEGRVPCERVSGSKEGGGEDVQAGSAKGVRTLPNGAVIVTEARELDESCEEEEGARVRKAR